MHGLRYSELRKRQNVMHVSGGQLNTPRTPVERIVLMAKLKSLKRDFERRHPSERE